MVIRTTGRGTEKNKRRLHEIWPWILTMLISDCLMLGSCIFIGLTAKVILRNLVLSSLGYGLVWIYWLKLYRQERLSYNNSEHPVRFWCCMELAFLISMLCIFLPVRSWPIQAAYLLLVLFGSVSLGIVGGTVVLAIPSLILGVSLDFFFLYFVAGVFVAVIFQRYDGEVHVSVPASISTGGLVLCQVAGNLFGDGGQSAAVWKHTAFGLAVTILFSAAIQYFFIKKNFHRNKKIYARLLDPDRDPLQEFQKNSRLDYLKCAHAMYFCEKIAYRLGWHVDSLKCAARYYKWGNDLPELIRREKFPARCKKILLDYFNNEIADIPQVRYRETAAIVCTDIVLGSMIYLVNKETALPRYDVIIDAIFERMIRKGAFDKCELSGRDLHIIKELFKEETYYYDSLRRK